MMKMTKAILSYISLDVLERDITGPLDSNMFHVDNLNGYDEDTLPYDPESTEEPTSTDNFADNIENGGTIANPVHENEENQCFFNVTEAQLEYIAAQTMADSTKDQTKWGIKIFKGMYWPTIYKKTNLSARSRFLFGASPFFKFVLNKSGLFVQLNYFSGT